MFFLPKMLRNNPYLEIRHVEIEGAVIEDPENLQDCVAMLVGENLLAAPYEEAAHRLLSRPRIRAATWSLRPPHDVIYRVTERRGEVLIMSERFYEVDGEGIVLPPPAGLLTPDLPILSGFDETRLVPGNRIVDPRLADALRVLDLLGEAGFETGRHLSEIRMSDGSIDLIWQQGGGSIVKVGREEFEKRIRKYRDAYAVLEKEGVFPVQIDLRFENQVVLTYDS